MFIIAIFYTSEFSCIWVFLPDSSIDCSRRTEYDIVCSLVSCIINDRRISLIRRSIGEKICSTVCHRAKSDCIIKIDLINSIGNDRTSSDSRIYEI